MANDKIVFNVALGMIRYYVNLPGTNDAVIVVPLEVAGLEDDLTLGDHPTLASVLAGTTNEQTTMGRKTVTGAAVLPDFPNDWVDYDCDDILWEEAAGNTVGAALFAYVPDVATSTDAEIIPLTKQVWNVVPNGNDTIALIAPEGFARSKNAVTA